MDCCYFQGGNREEEFSHYSFEDAPADADQYNFCVVLYDYSKVNSNDLEVQ